jgi:hypothetical protein
MNIYFEFSFIALALHSQQHLLMSHELQHVSHQSHPHIQPTSSGLEIADLPSPNAASTFPTTSPMIVGQELENTENIVDLFSTRRAFGTNHPVSYTRKEWEQDERKHNLASKLRAINKKEINDKLQIEIQNDDPQAEFGLPSNGLESERDTVTRYHGNARIFQDLNAAKVPVLVV